MIPRPTVLVLQGHDTVPEEVQRLAREAGVVVVAGGDGKALAEAAAKLPKLADVAPIARAEAEQRAAAQSLGLLAGMAGAFGFGFGSDLPPLKLSPPVRKHTNADALARAEAKRERKARRNRGEP